MGKRIDVFVPNLISVRTDAVHIHISREGAEYISQMMRRRLGTPAHGRLQSILKQPS